VRRTSENKPCSERVRRLRAKAGARSCEKGFVLEDPVVIAAQKQKDALQERNDFQIS